MNKHNKLWCVVSILALPLMLAACGGGSSGNIPNLSSLVDGTNEGSVSNPVLLTVGTSRPSSVAPVTGVTEGSYYYFVATLDAPVTISMSNVLVLLRADLYENPNFTSSIASCTALVISVISCNTTVNLVPGRSYYLRVRSVNPAADKFTLLVRQL